MIKRIIKITSLVIILTLFLGFLQDYYFSRPASQTLRNDGFYLEDRNSLDVLFMGASEVYSGFSSALAYKQQGFTSYPYAFTGNPDTLWKNELKEALRYQKPKLVVVEVNGALYDPEDLYDDSKLRQFTDSMPLSENKIETVNRFATEDKLSYYLTILKYHSRWNEVFTSLSWMTDRLFMKARGYSLLRGSFTRTGYDSRGKVEDVANIKGVQPLSNDARYYLLDFLQYCKDNKVNVLFVRFPHLISDQRAEMMYRRSKTVKSIVSEYGYSFLDMEPLRKNIGLKKNDYYNNDHLNIKGQRKLTTYLAAYIARHYDVSGDDLTPKQKAEWDKSAEYIDLFYDYFQVQNKMDIKNYKGIEKKQGHRMAVRNKDINETMGLIRKLDQMKRQLQGESRIQNKINSLEETSQSSDK